jgi:four helix bundle protein
VKKKAMNYEDLEIWKIANELVLQIHQLTINDIPKFEMFETGSQIRRSIKSVKANIVEGYGRRNYKQDFIRFLVIAQASNDETIDHLKTLFLIKSLTDKEKYEQYLRRLEELGKKINRFISAVKKEHRI